MSKLIEPPSILVLPSELLLVSTPTLPSPPPLPVPPPSETLGGLLQAKSKKLNTIRNLMEKPYHFVGFFKRTRRTA